MNKPIHPPQMDPWAPGVRAADVPIAEEIAFDGFGTANEPLAPNAAEIRQFLGEQLGSCIHLVAIIPDGTASGKYFGDDADAATQWAVDKNKSGSGLYFTVNVTKEGLNKKPSKAEIVAARFGHSDIDPPKDGGALDRAAIMSRLMQGVPPSIVIDSGNGLQPLWRLDHAPTDWGPVEDINRSITDRFGGDTSACNVDRLLRVPGTVNYPNAKKRAAGRVATMATLAHVGSGDAIYGLAELARAFPPRKDEKPKEGPQEEFKGDFKLLTPDDLGLSPLSPLRSAGKDRSADGLRAAGDMLRAGFTEEHVLGILLNKDNKVAAHYLDQKDPRRAALRTIEYAADDKAAREEQSSGYRLVTFDEMDAEPDAKQWLIKGILARGETSAWIAPPGAMKSALLAEAAICVGAGLDWHGYRNKGAAGVIYFAIERADLVRRRMRAHRQRLGLKGTPICLSSDTIDLTHPESYKKLIDTIRAAKERLGVDIWLIIIDTFAKLIAAAGGDENSAKDQGAVFANLQRVKNETGVHVALIGHTGKDESKGSRGSNAILGDVDVMVTISGGEIKTATVTKANDAPEGVLFSFKSDIHDFGTDEDGDPKTVNVVSSEFCQTDNIPKSREKKLTESQEAMLRLLWDAGPAGLSTSDWNAKARDIGIGVNRKATLHNLKAQLKDRNLVREYNDVWQAQKKVGT